MTTQGDATLHICGGCGSRENVDYLLQAALAAANEKVEELLEALDCVLMEKPLPNGEYVHRVACSGDRRKPAGTVGISCSCRVGKQQLTTARAEVVTKINVMREALEWWQDREDESLDKYKSTCPWCYSSRDKALAGTVINHTPDCLIGRALVTVPPQPKPVEDKSFSVKDVETFCPIHRRVTRHDLTPNGWICQEWETHQQPPQPTPLDEEDREWMDAPMGPLKPPTRTWTREKPTEPGWYWTRFKPGCAEVIIFWPTEKPEGEFYGPLDSPPQE